MNAIITAEEAKNGATEEPYPVAEILEWFSYDPLSGIVFWRKKPAKNVCVGDPAGYLWRSKNTDYIRIALRGNSIFAHVVAWICQHGEYPPGGQVDHGNGVGTDNRYSNLRAVTHAVNMRNQRRNSQNKSGVMGVDQLKSGRWRARIILDQRERSLGCFSDFFDAVCARKSAERRFGFHANHGRV